VSADTFVSGFIAGLHRKSAELQAYGASAAGQACERIAQDLEEEFRAWWLAELTVNEAAEESGYSEERLREMARAGTIPHRKGEGDKGHVMIARKDLTKRPRAPEAIISTLETRLLRRPTPLRKRV
jgi:hypothetical protein